MDSMIDSDLQHCEDIKNSFFGSADRCGSRPFEEGGNREVCSKYTHITVHHKVESQAQEEYGFHLGCRTVDQLHNLSMVLKGAEGARGCMGVSPASLHVLCGLGLQCTGCLTSGCAVPVQSVSVAEFGVRCQV